jgi:formylglycine-generating enzyme required for sulfatase activity
MLALVKSYLADKLIPIPGGSQVMRNFYDEQKWISSNSKMSIPGRKHNLIETRREVDIRPFQLLQIPVTTDLYDFVMGEETGFSGNGFPVVNVSWHDAISFCNSLSQAIGLNPCYTIDVNTGQTHCDWEKDGFRMPAEAEWQHACRAGSRGYQYGKLDDIAWYQENSNNSIHKAGEKVPNQWGVYDMLGNVWEWCWDLYDEKHYGPYRVIRGGSWAEPYRSCGATCRRKGPPTYKTDDLGFRIAKLN